MADTWYDGWGNEVPEGDPSAAYNGSAFDRGLANTSTPLSTFPQNNTPVNTPMQAPTGDPWNNNAWSSFQPTIQQSPAPTAPPQAATSDPWASYTDQITKQAWNPALYQKGPYSDPKANYQFSLQQSATTPPKPPAANPFTSNPFMPNPTGTAPNGQSYNLNPEYWATKEGAEQAAKMLGGTVVTGSNLLGGFTNNQPQYMIKMPDGREINPGLDVAALFGKGRSQNYIDSYLNALKADNYPANSGQASPPTVLPSSIPEGYNSNLNFNFGQTQQPAPQQQQQQNPIQQVLQQLTGQQQQNPLLGLIAQLYGSNPFTAAFGNNPLAQQISSSTNNTNMASIAQLLNAMFSMRDQPSTGILSPLFWGQQNNNGGPLSSLLSNYYPTFQ